MFFVTTSFISLSGFLRLLFVVTTSHTFLVFDDLGNFEDSWLGVL